MMELLRGELIPARYRPVISNAVRNLVNHAKLAACHLNKIYQVFMF